MLFSQNGNYIVTRFNEIQQYPTTLVNYTNIMLSRNTQSQAYITYDTICKMFKSRQNKSVVSEVKTIVAQRDMGCGNDEEPSQAQYSRCWQCPVSGLGCHL